MSMCFFIAKDKYLLQKISNTSPIIILPNTANGIIPAASTIPTAIDQNKNASSHPLPELL